MSMCEMRPARARYNKRFFTAMFVYVVAVLSAAWIFKHHPPTGATAFLLALLPALPLLSAIFIIAVYMREETDEVEKAAQIEAMVWGIGLTLSVSTLWGFLELFNQVPHADTYLAFPVFCVFWGIASVAVRRRYR